MDPLPGGKRPKHRPSAGHVEAIPAPKGLEPLTVRIVRDSWLCDLEVWSDDAWAALPAEKRPPLACHFEGLGWVCCLPVTGLN